MSSRRHCLGARGSHGPRPRLAGRGGMILKLVPVDLVSSEKEGRQQGYSTDLGEVNTESIHV